MNDGKESVGVEEAREAIASGEAKALDIREEDAWNQTRVPGAIHVPAEELSSRLEELDSDQRLMVFAPDDASGREAVSTLREKGHDAALVEGGIEAWGSEGFMLQPTEDLGEGD
jgi:rhodanese-related sulfurtransferase